MWCDLKNGEVFPLPACAGALPPLSSPSGRVSKVWGHSFRDLQSPPASLWDVRCYMSPWGGRKIVLAVVVGPLLAEWKREC